MLPLAIDGAWFYSKNQENSFPSGAALLFTLVAGFVYFFADFFFVGAYTSGGKLLTITTIVIMFTVLASIVKYFWVGQTPNKFQIIGYIFAVIAIFF